MPLKVNRSTLQTPVVTFRANFAGSYRIEQHNGQDHIVVPVVMLRETVVNNALVPATELKPQGWNGVPVTIGHPEMRGVPTTANSPKALEQWAVGRVFNARLEHDKLKAEAWIDMAAAEQVRPGIVSDLQSGVKMDVSTGYFSTGEAIKGVFNGRRYVEVHRDLKPDHLALLPDEPGACSWQDGCGVRANKGSHTMNGQICGCGSTSNEPQTNDAESMIGRLLGGMLMRNRRGNEDDIRQMIADLISNDQSPFVPDDEFSLREMSSESLRRMRDDYLKANTYQENSMSENKDGTEPQGAAMTAEQIKEIITNTVRDELKAHRESEQAEEREALVEQITANAKGVDAESLKALSVSALKALVAGMGSGESATVQPDAGTEGEKGGDAPKANADFSGRGAPAPGGEASTLNFNQMVPPRTFEKKETAQ